MGEVYQKVIVGVCTLGVFICMAREYASPEVAFLCALVIVTISGVLSLEEMLSGFSNPSVITIGALFLVVGAVDRTHIMDYGARSVFGVNSSAAVGSIRIMTSTFALSSVFNNTPLVALLIPIIRDWARGKSIALSQLLIPLSYSAVAGGLLTMIGTSTSLTVQGLLGQYSGQQFSFFAPAVVALPCGVLLIIYMIVAARYLLPSRSGLLREARDRTRELVAEVQLCADSVFVGKELGTMLARLGTPATNAIKIRRRRRGTTPVDRSGSKSGSHAVRAVPGPTDDLANQSWNNVPFASESRRRPRTMSYDVPSAAKTMAELETGGAVSVDDMVLTGRAAGTADSEYVRRAREAWGRLPNSDPDSEADHIEMGHVESSACRHSSATVPRLPVYEDVIAPQPHETLHEGDIVFISSAQEVVTKLLMSLGGENSGLHILDSNVLDLPGFGSEVVELVISGNNPFIGRNLGSCAAEFSEKYRVGIISTRARASGGDRSPVPSATGDTGGGESSSSGHGTGALAAGDGREGENEEDVARLQLVENHRDAKTLVLGSGDLILCLASAADAEALSHHPDFFVASVVGSVPKPVTLAGSVPVAVFLLMIIVVAAGALDMCVASLAVAALFLAGRWLKPSDIPVLVDLRLLLLMGCALSFAQSMSSSGLSADVAVLIRSLDTTPAGSLFVLYFATTVVTEMVSNNAAAALMFPVAMSLAEELNASPLPFAMVVLVAATAAFMSPIGYQTHVMVWGAGGYRFADFLRFGFVPNAIFLVGTCVIVPIVYPL